MLTKYALAEFDVGSQDRGRSVFEELVSNYPKRTDLWHVYVDKEIKSGMHDRARQLFERMIASTAMNPRNVKVVFKKYMAFEQVKTPLSTSSVSVHRFIPNNHPCRLTKIRGFRTGEWYPQPARGGEEEGEGICAETCIETKATPGLAQGKG